LLVGPPPAERPQGERVDVREAGRNDKPAVDEVQPAVLHEQRRQRDSEYDRPERKHNNRQPVALQQVSRKDSDQNWFPEPSSDPALSTSPRLKEPGLLADSANTKVLIPCVIPRRG
jgi:hypothetical protein